MYIDDATGFTDDDVLLIKKSLKQLSRSTGVIKFVFKSEPPAPVWNSEWPEQTNYNPAGRPYIRFRADHPYGICGTNVGFSDRSAIYEGGQSIYLSCALVFLFGNQKSAGISKLNATNKGRKVNFAIRTKVGIHKNHMNGLGYADCKILATTHGFIEDDKKAIDTYKSDNKDYWAEVFETVGDDVLSFDVVEGDVIESPVDYSDN